MKRHALAGHDCVSASSPPLPSRRRKVCQPQLPGGEGGQRQADPQRRRSCCTRWTRTAAKATAAMQLKTDPEGKASFPGAPFGKLRVQVLMRGFQTYGEDFDISQPAQEITIKLKRPQGAVLDLRGQAGAGEEAAETSTEHPSADISRPPDSQVPSARYSVPCSISSCKSETLIESTESSAALSARSFPTDCAGWR